MKIGFFCNEYPPRPHGGIGTFVGMLAPALVKAGHNVTVVQWGDEDAIVTRDAVRIVTLAQSTTPRIAWLINRFRLWNWLRTEVEMGHIKLFEIPEYQGCLPFPFWKCPVVVRLHHAESHIRSIMGTEGAHSKIYWLEKATLFWHRNWIGVSRYILDAERAFFALEPRKKTVIYNPSLLVNADKLPVFTSRPEQYVVYVGSVSERKGALLLAEAMRDVFAVNHDVHLVYVGPETEYNGAPISTAIRTLIGKEIQRVIFTGRVPHELALAWIRDALALVLVSKIESFGLVALEAMSLGVPVIFAKCGVGPEIIDHGVDGIMVDPDSKYELIQFILTMIANPSHYASIGEAGRYKFLNKFNLTDCKTKTLKFYHQLKNEKNYY